MGTETKIDSLVDKIYKEGVDKSRAEADTILSSAKAEAEKIVADAKRDADALLADAKSKAAELERTTNADVKLASEQAVSALKQRVKSLVTAGALTDAMKASFVDADFLKTLILELAKQWNATEGFGENIAVYFPASMKGKIDAAFESSIKKAMSGAKIDFDGKLATGFAIVPEGTSYQLRFTDEEFNEFFKPYLREKTEAMLFGAK